MSVKVSVISPCYNHGKYIHEMLDSLHKQTLQNFEVIIVNDGSSDNTKEILDQISNDSLRVFHIENKGPAYARNFAIRHANAEIIMNLDADDKIAPDFLKECVSILETRPNVGIVYSEVEFFGAKSGIFHLEKATIENMLYDNRIVANACFRKSDWEKCGGYSEEMVYGLEDYDLWLSIIEQGRDIHKIDRTLVYYRQYEKSELCRTGRILLNHNNISQMIAIIFHRHENLYKKYPKIWGDFCTQENRENMDSEIKSNSEILQNPRPAFSIITPTCKRPHLLKRAIESVLSQSFQDFELIIIDDAKDLETVKTVLEFSSPKIRYFSHDKQKGASSAYNSGIKLARGKFINFLDDDDEYLPGILDKLYSTFNKMERDIGFLWTGIVNVKDTENGEETLSVRQWPEQFSDLETALIESTTIGNGFGLSVKKECIDYIGFYDESLKVGADTDFMIRLSAHYAFRVLPDVLVKIHHGNSQLTDPENNVVRRDCYKNIIFRHFEYLSQYWKLIYIHSNAYWNLCYNQNKRKNARILFLKLIKKYPSKFVIYADLFFYEFFKKSFISYKNR